MGENKIDKGIIKSYWSGIIRVSIVAVLVLVQLAAIIGLSIWLTGYTVYIYAAIEIASIFIMIGLVNDNRSPSFKISWICVILVVPLTGHLMYALWGKNGSKKKIDRRVNYKLRHGETFYEYNPEAVEEFTRRFPTKSRIVRSMESYSFPLYKNNQITYYPMGDETFKAVFEDMRNAKKFILINFYIIGDGILWREMRSIMAEKAAEGVEVLLVYDDFGAALRTEKDFRAKLERDGIKTRVFNPIHKYMEKLYMNYRNHQKIVVIDGEIGYTGGMNIADEYVNLVERFGVWKDNAVRVEGDCVWGMTVTFFQMWEVAGDEPLMDYSPYKTERVFPKNDVYCQFVSDGPANNPRNPIVTIYKEIMYYAKRYLYITTPYLVIDDDIKDVLITAVHSGIDVRLITPSIPDKRGVKMLTEYNYGPLLQAGIRIFEYSPGFIHAKTIINEDCGVVGTINMDYRSFYLHYECGTFICDSDTIDIIKSDLLDTMRISKEIFYEEWLNRPWHKKVWQEVLNLFATLM